MITVVTVCMNAGKDIAQTIESVLAQDYTDFEYLIKDGGSEDDTVKTAMGYTESFAKKGIPFRIVEEKDKGLYDAMNRGAELAEGEFVIFMNSGDCFFENGVLRKIFEGHDHKGIDLIYGDAVEEEFGEYYFYRKCPELIEERMPFNHQTVFARRDLLREMPFDPELAITADYDFLLKAKKAGRTFEDSNVVTALISKDGISTVKLKDTYLESIRVREKYGIEVPDGDTLEKELKKVKLKQFGMDHFPGWMKFCIRKAQRFIRKQKKLRVLRTERGYEIV
ncbi:MAG: glycosyltransferase [Lachnospiraceae bacterium]|nr:glycosyltransferase [Lachnospiraceae bacterium]